MRKLKLQMQTSLDGINSTGPHDEQKWVTGAWDEIKDYVINLANECDTELIGRKLTADYLPFWSATLKQPESPMYELAKVKALQKKIVFTKTLEKSNWKNTQLVKGNLKDEIINMKNEEGKDLIVYGGSSFVSSLIKEELVDEFHFMINPIAIGKGESAFSMLENWHQLKLIKSNTFKRGIVILHYETG